VGAKETLHDVPQPTSDVANARWVRWAAVLPAAAAVLAYSGALAGEFVYDDYGSIFANPRVVLGDWWGMAFGPDHTSLANRPFPCLTVVVNHALCGMDAWWFRVVDLALHVLNAWVVLGVIRRCLLSPNLRDRFSASRATWIATAIATLWACHPIGADSVTYITQRSTLLMSGGLLSCLYAVLRHAAAPGGRWWRLVAVVAMALGMASKEDLVVGPLLVVLFERAFVLPSWSALRMHVRFHLALSATWVVLLACVVAGPANETVGHGSLVNVSSLQWLYTQAGVIAHYVASVVWPSGLRTVYDWGIVRTAGPAVVPGLLVLALLAVAIWQWRRRPWLGWLGALFFLLLAPTSSVMPIITEVVAERRMYLPMLAVLVPVVIWCSRAAERLATRLRLGGVARTGVLTVLAAVPTAGEIVATRDHALSFTTTERFWSDAFQNNELTNGSLLVATILSGYARVLEAQGHPDEALAMLQRAMQCKTRMNIVSMNYAIALRDRGRLGDAERVLRDVVRDSPDFAKANGMLAAVLVDSFEIDAARGAAVPTDPRLVEADELTDRAYRRSLQPEYLNTRGMALCRQGRLAEAEAVLRLAILQDSRPTDPYKSLGAVLLFAGRPAEAIVVWQQILPSLPADTGLRLNLVAAHLQVGETDAARELLAEVLHLVPNHAGARRLSAQLESAPR